MRYRRRRAPVSTLRAKLQQRLAGEDSEEKEPAVFLPHEPAGSKPFFLVGALQTMFRYFPLKLAAALVLVFLVALLSKSGYRWGEPLLQGLRFVVEWDLDLRTLTEKAGPAFKFLSGDLDLPAFKMEGQMPGQEILPFAGELRSGFGLRADPDSGREEMHYGIDLAAPEGTAVKALLGGRVERVVSGKGSFVTIVIVPEPGWTMLYRGVTAAAVKEGESIGEGALLGKLGPAGRYDEPHLHFELHFDGHPVPPPAGWTAGLTLSAERT